MSTDLVETSNQKIDISGVIIRHEDGSFSTDGQRYLPEVKCRVLAIDLPYVARFIKLQERKDFDISKFELKFTQDDVLGVTIHMTDHGYADDEGKTIRTVARQHVTRRFGDYYLKVEIVDISYPHKRIQCRCISSSTEDGSLPDKVAISTDLDQFFCIGYTDSEPTLEMLVSAIATMNTSNYGAYPGRWYYDSDLKMVRSFNSHAKIAIGMMRPIEALQIASQLNTKGNWNKMQTHDMKVHDMKSESKHSQDMPVNTELKSK
jgi:hypothetical protein